MEDLAFFRMEQDKVGIFWFSQKEFSVIISLISLMRGSSEVEIEERRVSLALVLRSDNAGISITSGWYRAEFVKQRGRLSHFLTLRAMDCSLLVVDSATGLMARRNRNTDAR